MQRIFSIMCLTAFILFSATATEVPNAEAASAYQHVCQKCGTSITNKSPHGPANKKCRKGGTHSWKHIALK